MKKIFEIEFDGRLKPGFSKETIYAALAFTFHPDYVKAVKVKEIRPNKVVEDGQANDCAEKACNIYLSCTNQKKKQCYKPPAT